MGKPTRKHVQLKISLDEIQPQIWRRIVVPSAMSLHELHRTIQMMFEWYDYHLYEFTIRGARYQEPDPEAEDEPKDSTTAQLRDLGLVVGDEFTYVYDFGDHWVHRLEVERAPVRADPAWLPAVLGGDRRGPPEDCGGPGGFERFLESISDPDDPEHDEYRAWAGGDYDPDGFDLRTVRHAVLLASAWGSQL